jgi:3-oxoacyl-[acyl-carrier protein] reductase
MDISFDQKVVLVTGASRGIGKATAQLFADSGARVIINYHKNRSAAENTLASLPGTGHMIYLADLAIPSDLSRMIKDIIKVYGRIDILVNNAGIFEELDMTGISFDEFRDYWEQTIKVNLTGPALVSNKVAR